MIAAQYGLPLTTEPGHGYMEDPVAMLKKYPLMNDYWRDKRAQVAQVEVPAYILASYSTFLHLPGSLRGFEEIPHSKKWLVKTLQAPVQRTDLSQAAYPREPGVA